MPSSLAGGDAGLAVMATFLDRAGIGEGWGDTAEEFLSQAIDDVQTREDLETSLFSGFTGLAFAARMLHQTVGNHADLLDSIEDVLLGNLVDHARSLESPQHGMKTLEFDLIGGWTGIGAYLLDSETERARTALTSILDYLIRIAQPDVIPPRWFTPAAEQYREDRRETYPQGSLNCGLSHGIPGPIGLMALAMQRGLDLSGLQPCLHMLAGWLAGSRFNGTPGLDWPSALPAEMTSQYPSPTALDGIEHAGLSRSRCAWCYGNPGVARTLWLAGDACRNPQWQDIALEGMRTVFRRSVSKRNIDSPTVCHGVSGLLQVTLRFANDTGLAEFKTASEALLGQILTRFDPASIFGFRSLDVDAAPVDNPGLLDGAAGVVLVLLASISPVDPAWDRMLLLS